jgi:hypothetical protein
MESSVNAEMQTHKLIMQKQQKVQARDNTKTLEQQRRRLVNVAVSGISDLMKSKKSDQLTAALMM